MVVSPPLPICPAPKYMRTFPESERNSIRCTPTSYQTVISEVQSSIFIFMTFLSLPSVLNIWSWRHSQERIELLTSYQTVIPSKVQLPWKDYPCTEVLVLYMRTPSRGEYNSNFWWHLPVTKLSSLPRYNFHDFSAFWLSLQEIPNNS